MNLENSLPTARPTQRRGLALRYWFAGVALLGGVAIFIGERSAAGGWVTLGVPIGLMILYIAIGRAYLAHGISRTQYADSIYYLGFLFTLAAITAAIMEIGPDTEISEVVNRFGVKLITTLIGLGVRVYLVNFAPSSEEVAESVEESLSLAARRLRDRLDAVTLDLDALASSLSLTLKTASERISGEIGSVLTQAGTEFGASLGAMKNETTAALRELRAAATSGVGELTGGVAELETLRGQVRTVSRDLGAAFRRLVERIESMQLPDQVLARELGPTVEGLVAAMQEPARRLEALSAGVAASTGALSTAVRDAGTLAENAARLHREIEKLSTGIARIPPLDHLRVSVEQTERSLSGLARAAQDAGRSVTLLGNIGAAFAAGWERLRQLLRGNPGSRR